VSLSVVSDGTDLSSAEVALLGRAMRNGERGFVLAEMRPARVLFVVSAMEACGWVRFIRLRKRTRIVVTASGRAVWRWYVRADVRVHSLSVAGSMDRVMESEDG
jgi:hypothetical protein